MPRTRRLSGALAALLFLAVYPANLNMVRLWWDKPLPYRVAALARLPFQFPMIWAAIRVAREAESPTFPPRLIGPSRLVAIAPRTSGSENAAPRSSHLSARGRRADRRGDRKKSRCPPNCCRARQRFVWASSADVARTD